jgi:hypothetical protein
MSKSLPRGVSNNNPLNIEHNPRNPWQGLAVPPSDGRFARFVEPQWGIRAAILILRKYQQRGLTTLRQQISTWAPAHENNVENYIGFIVRQTGFRPEQRIDLGDKDQTIALLKAMVLMECGPAPAGSVNGNWLDDSTYEAGFSLAKPLAKSRTTRGSVMAGGAAVAGAILEAATEVLPQAADAATIVTPLWPEIARWVLIVVVIAGAALALHARLQARKDGVR